MHRQPPARLSRSEEIRRLKKRRDVLLCTACNRQERPDLLGEVREINRAIDALQKRPA